MSRRPSVAAVRRHGWGIFWLMWTAFNAALLGHSVTTGDYVQATVNVLAILMSGALVFAALIGRP